MRNTYKAILIIIPFFLFLLSATIIYLNFPLIPSHQITCIFINPNETFNEFLTDIKQKIPRTSVTLLKIYAKLYRIDRHLEAGEYCFGERASMINMLDKIKQRKRERHAFIIIAGWTYQNILEHLKEAPALNRKALLDDDIAIVSSLGLNKDKLEGEFYPDTYYYAYPDTPLKILQQAHQKMENRLQELYDASKKHFKNPYELLIAASIIEKESGMPDDQRLVSGVIVNRLKQKMRLQMDPTVMYGLGSNYHVHLTKQDLKNKSLYNTYLNVGLPPTPICMPGETALLAAAFPTDTVFLYYVSKNDGYLQFSEKLNEQNLAIKHYLKKEKCDAKS